MATWALCLAVVVVAFGGMILGMLIAALCAASGRASDAEELWQELKGE